MLFSEKTVMVAKADALPGRPEPIPTAQTHFVNGESLHPPFESSLELVSLGLGCFWGAEKIFWQLPGVEMTAVGYSGGHTPNPTYEEVCSGQTGHNEVVLVAYNPEKIAFTRVLIEFWQAHDPTQGMQQGNDVGTQYRSGVYTTTDEQESLANESKRNYQGKLSAARMGKVTTEIKQADPFYYAEDYHQQYLAKNPAGYCDLGGTGVAYAGS